MTKAVFLDRDGTINSDEHGYINKPENFELYDFSAEAVRKLNQLGYLVFIVTNQSGIARGFYTEKDLNEIHEKMLVDLKKQQAEITEIFVSPYHKDGIIEPFNIDHEDRKPGLGMYKKAMEKYNFSLRKSYVIGDKYADIEFGRKAGLKTILVLSGNGKNEFLQNRQNWNYKPDYIAEHLLHAAKLIEDLEKL